jgi:16S rRNA (guanine527-N7)-methyltransferase
MTAETRLISLLGTLKLAVDPLVVAPLLSFLDELEHWNRSHNLTAVSDPNRGLEIHLVDSLTLLPYLPVAARMLDFGSGAGLPGLPLKIARADLALCSVDAVAKKLAFQRHVVRKFGLSGVEVIHRRLEDLAQDGAWLGCFSRVVFRAVGDLFRFAPLAQPLLAEGGWLIAMKGPEGDADWGRLQQSPIPGFKSLQLASFSLPESGAKRTLIVLQKAD